MTRMASGVDVVALVDEGLGNTSYLVDLGDGRALVVDPGRDPRPYRSEAARRTDLAVVDGGTDGWAALPGNQLEPGG